MELRLETITTLADANAFLPRFLVHHNARFTVPPAEPEPAWRALPAGLEAEAVFCFHYPRRVARDATVSWGAGALALPRRPDGRSWAGTAIVLEERLDGSLWACHEARHYPLSPAPAAPGLLRARHLATGSAGRADRPSPRPDPTPRWAPGRPRPTRPGPDHPWRRSAHARTGSLAERRSGSLAVDSGAARVTRIQQARGTAMSHSRNLTHVDLPRPDCRQPQGRRVHPPGLGSTSRWMVGHGPRQLQGASRTQASVGVWLPMTGNPPLRS